MKKTAVVLLNFGGPDSSIAIKPFLFNLFNDPAIINSPKLIRIIIAWFLCTHRKSTSKKIYANFNYKSPLLNSTNSQAEAIKNRLDKNTHIFIAMRYWHPFIKEVAISIKQWDPDQIILLPLYPQFSTVTTLSSIKEWQRVTDYIKLTKPTKMICCYPINKKMIEAQAFLLKKFIKKTKHDTRVLFSAHGLLRKIINSGDCYKEHVELTANAIIEKLEIPNLDWIISYQSRIGKMDWIEPFTDSEIRRAGNDGKALIIQPITFVSECSETKFELDIKYSKLARDVGVPLYLRVPTLGSNKIFIDGLIDLIMKAKATNNHICSNNICSMNIKKLCDINTSIYCGYAI